MTRRQDFHGDVQQVLQADTVTQYTAVVSLPDRRPESELQAAFKLHTGIHCSRDVRIQMEHLMGSHGFTAQELARAWKVGSLVWHEPSKRLMSRLRTLDTVVGWTGTFVMTTVLIVSLVDTMVRMPGPFLKPLTLAASFAVYLVVTRSILLATIFPQATAKRVEKILEGELMC